MAGLYFNNSTSITLFLTKHEGNQNQINFYYSTRGNLTEGKQSKNIVCLLLNATKYIFEGAEL